MPGADESLTCFSDLFFFGQHIKVLIFAKLVDGAVQLEAELFYD